MTKTLYVFWGLAVCIAIVAGLRSQPPKNSAHVLSALQYPAPSPFAVRLPGSPDPVVRAKYAILIDAGSFYSLYKKNAYTPVPVASTTKIMTALVVLERYNLEDAVTISKKAVRQIGSSTGLRAGEAITVGSLLKALLIQSGNDAAYALAEHGGSVDQFVEQMNIKAWELGMRSTKFKDPAGLDDDGYSTAHDLAILAAAAAQEKIIVDISQTAQTTISSTDGLQRHALNNSNRLVTEEMYFPGAIGLKTGFTPAAGHTLVAVAERGGRMLISVILLTLDDTKEASARESYKLLSWGFANHHWLEDSLR